MEQIVFPQAPYNMMQVFYKLAMDPHYKLEMSKKELSFPVRIKRYAEESRWKKGICILTDIGEVDQPKVKVTLIGEELTSEDQEWLVKNLSHRFQWNSQELVRFCDFMKKQDHPELYSLIEKYRGTPLTLDESTYEGLIKTIVHQQVNLRFAHQLVYSLSMDYGEIIHYNEETYAFFPTASQLARVEVDELRQKKFSQRKAEYITGLARKITANELDLQLIEPLTNEEIIELLTKERGVGRWTVECILLFCLARPTLFPVGDVGIQNAIKTLEGLEQKPTMEECKEWIKPYEEWGSYLAIYLWESLGNNRVKNENVKKSIIQGEKEYEPTTKATQGETAR